MKRTRKLESQVEELFRMKCECPYCTVKRVYRSLHEEPEYVKCKSCKKDFAIDYELGDEEAWLIKQGMFVNYVGDRKLDVKFSLGLTISGNFWDEVQDETLIWVRFGSEKYAVNIYDLEIDKLLNEDNW
jgi:hypothetical protein